MPIFLDTSRK